MRDKILKRQDPYVNEILKDASVSILGCGGLGSNIAMSLARCGVGTIHLYDFDKVEYSNLNRQNYDLDDLGKSKVLQTKKKIHETIPYTKIYANEVYVSLDNLDEISKKTDIFIEAFDKKGAKVEYSKVSEDNFELKITKGSDVLVIPMNKNYGSLNGNKVELDGLSINTGNKVYVPQKAVDLIK